MIDDHVDDDNKYNIKAKKVTSITIIQYYEINSDRKGQK